MKKFDDSLTFSQQIFGTNFGQNRCKGWQPHGGKNLAYLQRLLLLDHHYHDGALVQHCGAGGGQNSRL